jgi:uncharacterized membrane protein
VFNNAFSYALLGMDDKAQEIVKDYLTIRKGKPVSSYSVACVFAAMGKSDEAFRWLDRAYQQHDPILGSLQIDPQWDRHRSDPRYIKMLKRMGLAE